jgi:prepilin-type N-terminal cleavage/methylation domain-containing protein
MSRQRAFTLIELLISVGISAALAAAAATSFVQIRAMVQRRDVLLGMHRSSEVLHQQLAQRLSQVMQQGAFVVDASAVVRSGSAKPTVRMLYLRGKESTNDWAVNFPSGTDGEWFRENTDLYWELWEYRPEEQALYSACSSRQRSFTISAAFGAPGASLTGQAFSILPRPRRSLADPAWWVTLDDNRLFPNAATPSVSDAHADDIGDWTELQRKLRPVVSGLSEFSVAIEAHRPAAATTAGDPLYSARWDPVSKTASSAGSAAPLILEGIRQDGQVADASGRSPDTVGWTWADTAAAKRPRIVRLRWTHYDGQSGISQTFSHSFVLPGSTGLVRPR